MVRGRMPRPPPSFARVGSLEEFLGPPARRYIVFRSLAYWQLEHRAFGSIIWGRPDESDVMDLGRAHAVGAGFPPHTTMVDVRDIQSVDLLAFEKFLTFLRERRAEWSPNVTRQAVLYRGGLAHASVLGMFDLLRPGHRVDYFDDPAAAYAAVGAEGGAAELVALRAELQGAPDIVRRVRLAFEALPPRADFDAVAKQMGMSLRSLQRRLGEANTSLRAQQQEHLLRASELLLESSELDLDAIAARVGASSASHLVTLFKRHRGISPGQLRERLKR
jgi:AraC-like DNA-binding protein